MPEVNDMRPAETRGYTPEERRGIVAGFFCYVLWGIFPVYWKLLSEVNSFEVTAHRIIWCFVTMAIVCAITRAGLLDLLKQPRAWRFLAPAAFLVAANWTVYIYAVNANHVVETSIGYYINPLVSILLGIVLFRERLSLLQGIAVVLCAIGVIYFTVDYGEFPWIALALAFTFGLYGALKKQGSYPAIASLGFENTVTLVPAIIAAIVLAQVTGSHAFAANLDTPHGVYLTALLILGGPVTALPLILFAKGATTIPLSMMGFLQYVNPTLVLLIGVFAFGEPFTVSHAVCFAFIWAGLTLVAIDAFYRNRR